LPDQEVSPPRMTATDWIICPQPWVVAATIPVHQDRKCVRIPPTPNRDFDGEGFDSTSISLEPLAAGLQVAAEKHYDVFLSYSHLDAALVEKMGVRLADEAKLNVWLDKWVLVPGENWQQHMAKGLNQARCCAVCIGSKTPKGWFQEEIERALNLQTADPTFRVIPVILPGGDPALVDDFLQLRTWVDFSEGADHGLAFHRLLSGVRGTPPGQYKPVPQNVDHVLQSVRDHLTRIRELRQQQLIDEDIALEFQRRLVDQLIGPGGVANA
jgi:hypothetical protein